MYPPFGNLKNYTWAHGSEYSREIRKIVRVHVQECFRATYRLHILHCLSWKSTLHLKFTIADETCFNYWIYIDIIYIEKRNCMNIVDSATWHQVAQSLQKESLGAIWNARCHSWLDAYLGLHDVITHDAGDNMSSRYLADSCATASFGTVHVSSGALSCTTASRVSSHRSCGSGHWWRTGRHWFVEHEFW